jgi:hypothetical protein
LVVFREITLTPQTETKPKKEAASIASMEEEEEEEDDEDQEGEEEQAAEATAEPGGVSLPGYESARSWAV